MTEWIDISAPITSGMVVWPGDPEVSISRKQSIAEGSDSNNSEISMSAHTGTHMDAPAHFIEGAPGMDSLPLAAVMGRARVVELPGVAAIWEEHLAPLGIQTGERLLIKTSNSDRDWARLPFSEDYAHLSPAGGRFLAGLGVACVGLDYLSVAGYGDEAAETHLALLEAGVWLIEGLYLRGVAPGDYELACLPLPLAGTDGAPARVAIKPVASGR